MNTPNRYKLGSFQNTLTHTYTHIHTHTHTHTHTYTHTHNYNTPIHTKLLDWDIYVCVGHLMEQELIGGRTHLPSQDAIPHSNNRLSYYHTLPSDHTFPGPRTQQDSPKALMCLKIRLRAGEGIFITTPWAQPRHLDTSHKGGGIS